MKYIFLLLFIIVFQQSHSQKKGSTIYTISGDSFFTKNYSTHKDDISFISNKKRHKLPYSQIVKIVHTGKKEKHNLTKKYVMYSLYSGTLMEELIDGKVSLFRRSTMGVSGAGTMGPTFSNSTTYYVKRSEEMIAENIGLNDLFKNYKKTSKDFFSDCPELVAKLENNEFKKNEIEEVVIFYNENCSN